MSDCCQDGIVTTPAKTLLPFAELDVNDIAVSWVYDQSICLPRSSEKFDEDDRGIMNYAMFNKVNGYPEPEPEPEPEPVQAGTKIDTPTLA